MRLTAVLTLFLTQSTEALTLNQMAEIYKKVYQRPANDLYASLDEAPKAPAEKKADNAAPVAPLTPEQVKAAADAAKLAADAKATDAKATTGTLSQGPAAVVAAPVAPLTPEQVKAAADAAKLAADAKATDAKATTGTLSQGPAAVVAAPVAPLTPEQVKAAADAAKLAADAKATAKVDATATKPATLAQ